MDRNLISCCYHPTKVVLIDDNESYLNNLQSTLDFYQATYQTYANPMFALERLTKNYHASSFINRCLSYPEEEQPDTQLVQVDIRKIHQEMYNRFRFDELSVIVVDYAMPGLDGVEFCSQLHNLPVKKILLTGIADENVAIDAFNKKIIDKFIRKDAVDFSATINSAIREMQNSYFYDLAKIVINNLTLNPNKPVSSLSDPVFIKFFEKLCTELKPCEYYLMDQAGCFIFLDIDANPSWLVVKTEEEMHALTKFAEMDNTTPDTLNALNERSKIPYFHTDHELQTPAKNWSNYLHSAKMLSGRELYYYAIITDHKKHDIEKQKILSYRDYLQR